ncbi:hypothetical protein B0H14DRAFT_3151706 [Mycena olivaceomarginata]|nr:hypothetical protein B0H14DRAFT_3151706 [Mycena olivaceomarginata]
MLQNLPPELITAVFKDLPQSDVASSVTVSRVVGYVAERTLYSNVVVDHQTVQALAKSLTTRPERAAFVTCLQVTDKLKGLDIGDNTVGSLNTQNRIPQFLSAHPELTSVELRFPEILEPQVPAISLTKPIYLPAMRHFEGDLAVLLACVHHSPGLINVRTDVRTVQLGDITVFRTLADHMKNIQRLGFLTNWPVGELLSVICSCFPNIRALRISKSAAPTHARYEVGQDRAGAI